MTGIGSVGFVGLGVMGYPMAGHLSRAGYEVRVYNRTGAKSERWVSEHGGTRAGTPREAAEDAEDVRDKEGPPEAALVLSPAFVQRRSAAGLALNSV